MNKPPRRLLIVACSRSGTRYTSEYMKAHGIDIGHERVRADGACGWPYIFCVPHLCANESRADYDWQTVLHQTREPQAVIGSLMTHLPGMVEWIFRQIGVRPPAHPLERAMRLWVEMNTRAEAITPKRYRVEDLHPGGPAEATLFAAAPPTQPATAVPSTQTNARRHLPITWREMRVVDPGLTKQIQSMGARYGYA